MKEVTGIVVVAQAERPLAELAGAINAAHGQCEEAMRASLKHALDVGALLAEAKRRLAHGKWGHWLKANVEFSDRTARNYLRLHEHRDRLGESATTVADLSYRDALALLTDKRESEEGEQTDDGAQGGSADPLDGWPGDPEDREQHWRWYQRWWDFQAGHVLAFAGRGLTAVQLAERMPSPLWQVERILSPAMPDRLEELRDRSPGVRTLYGLNCEALLAYATGRAARGAERTAEARGWDSDARRFADLATRSEASYWRLCQTLLGAEDVVSGEESYSVCYAAREDVWSGIGYWAREDQDLWYFLDVEGPIHHEKMVKRLAQAQEDHAGMQFLTEGGDRAHEHPWAFFRVCLNREVLTPEELAAEFEVDLDKAREGARKLGRSFRGAQQRLSPEEFSAWLRSEHDIGTGTASRFIEAAEAPDPFDILAPHDMWLSGNASEPAEAVPA